MGLEVVVPRTGACAIADLVKRLAQGGLSAQVLMVDGNLHGPNAPVKDDWRDVRLKLAAGTLSLKRRPDGIAVVVFGNADAALTDAQRQVAAALSSLGEA
jgi:hypothetical protein